MIEEAIRLSSEESSTWLEADLARHITTLLPPTAARSGRALVAKVDLLARSAADR